MENKELIEKIQILVRQERRIGVEILELLHEIEVRKAYSELGYDGLFSFCVKELRYSEAQAYRRLQAMRALRSVPELKEKIESGKMTVTTVSQVQTYLREEQKKGVELKPEAIAAVFTEFENCPAKEVEIRLQQRQGRPSDFRLVIDLSPELAQKWEAVKNLSAHRTQGQPQEILDLLLQSWLQREAPSQARENKPSPRRGTSFLRKVSAPEAATAASPSSRPGISMAIKRAVWKRDQGQCQNCGSRFAIQFDHLQPVAKGGATSEENLRLLCRSCNLAAGVKIFGPEKMRRAGPVVRSA